MRAVGSWRYGGPEVLELVELPDPVPAERQVRIRVAAAAVNPADNHLLSGDLRALMPEQTRPFVAGLELAGRIDLVGAGAKWQVGDPVVAVTTFIGNGRGAHAELVVVDDACVARLPAALDPVSAAVVPMSGLTARLVLDTLALPRGASLVVVGAAGAVGGFVVQLAVGEGLRTIGVARAEDEPLIRGYGADFVARGASAAKDVAELVPGGADGVVDAALLGAAVLPMARAGGHVILLRPLAVAPEREVRVTPVSVRSYLRESARLQELVDLAAAGDLELRVAATYPPERAVEAYARVDRGRARGRTVVLFGGPAATPPLSPGARG